MSSAAARGVGALHRGGIDHDRDVWCTPRQRGQYVAQRGGLQ
jgi:hypothetical protein